MMTRDLDFDELQVSKPQLKREVIHPPKMGLEDLRDFNKLRDMYVAQWDEIVTQHHGRVLMNAVVTVQTLDASGRPIVAHHKHEGFVIARNHECPTCEAAFEREFELRTARPIVDRDKIPRISYTLQVSRRVYPRERLEVPLPVPRHRKGNKRIQKKWMKRAEGKTTIGYRMEGIEVSVSKTGLNLIRKTLSERSARASK